MNKREEIIKLLTEISAMHPDGNPMQAINKAAKALKLLSLDQPTSVEGMREEFMQTFKAINGIEDAFSVPAIDASKEEIFNWFASRINIPESREPDGYIYKGYYYHSLKQLNGETIYEGEEPTPIYLSPVERVKGMQWVKSHYRKPDKECFYFVKNNKGIKAAAFYSFNDGWIHNTGNPVIEWLDESTPSEGRVFVSDEMIERHFYVNEDKMSTVDKNNLLRQEGAKWLRDQSVHGDGWIDVNEHPKESGYYLAVINSYHPCAAYYHKPKNYWSHDSECYMPTHWQPLPAPPSQPNQEERG